MCLLLRRYYIRTPSMKLPISGCSFECYREGEVKSCCPGYWGPDCIGEYRHASRLSLRNSMNTPEDQVQEVFALTVRLFLCSCLNVDILKKTRSPGLRRTWSWVFMYVFHKCT